MPALAGEPASHNALSRGPVMEAQFLAPPTPAEVKAAESAKADSIAEAGKAEGDPRQARRPEPRKAEAGTPLPGMIASVYDYATGSIAMYRLPKTVGDEMVKISDVSSYYGGTYHDGLYYACHDGRFDDYYSSSDPHGHKIQAYDIYTWEPVGDEVNIATYRASDLTVSPIDGMAYAYCDVGEWMFKLYRIDLATGQQTALHNYSLTNSGRALCFDSLGELYAVDTFGSFGPVDMTTGRVTEMSGINMKGNGSHGWSMALDPDTGNFLFMYNGSPDYDVTQESRLYSIDSKTGEFTLLADWTGKCITSLAVVPELVEMQAPDAVKDIEATFADGALDGTVSFTMPTTLYDGSAASGTASWRVLEGDTELASGQAAYSARVNAGVTLGEAGLHIFSVVASNEAGAGVKNRLTVWVGPDVPKAPTDVAVAEDADNHTYTVTWNPVTEGVHGGYINGSAVRYTVRRMPSDTVVATDIAETSYTDTYFTNGLENLYYEVVASHAGNVSETGASTPMIAGYLDLPYDMSERENNHLLDNWTVIDSNGDGSTWDEKVSYGQAYIYYNYDMDNAADDWAITPPIKALAGYKYLVHAVLACQMSSYEERVEVKAGAAPTAEAMTREMLPPTVIKNDNEGQVFDMELTPDWDGALYIGFHAISDANMYQLKLMSLTIRGPINESAPVPPVVTEVTADRTGALKAAGKVEVPTLATNGVRLNGVSSVEVMRNGVPVATIENPVPGSIVEFSDDAIPAAGEYSYIAYAYYDEYRSEASDVYTTFVGINRPGDVPNILARRVPEDPSKISVTWDKPEYDIQGYPLNGDVSYRIEVYPDNAYYDSNAVYEGITDTSFTFTPTFESGADYGFIYVKVKAVNSVASGWGNESNNIFIGEALKAPFKESFPAYTLENPWGDGESNGPRIASISDDTLANQYNQYNGWNRMMDESFQSSAGAQDGDNGFAGMFGWSYSIDAEGTMHNEYTELLSPFIDLSTVTDPKLTFYTYNWHQNGFADPNTLEVFAMTEDGERHELLNFVIGDLGSVQDWMYVSADLSDFAGEKIGLIFKGTIRGVNDRGYNWILLDNIRVEHLPGVDLAVSHAKAPVQAVPNEAFTVEARVTNLGTDAVAGYTATLTHNGKEVASKSLGALAPSTFEIVEFQHSLSVQDPIGNFFQIHVTADGDEVAGNDVSEEMTVARNLQLLPEPQAVRAYPEENMIRWAAPDFESAAPAAITDDFESYPCFEADQFLTEAGDWIFVDVDQHEIGGMINGSTLEMLELPGIPNYSKQSWWVQNSLYENFNATYEGFEGSYQYLANMYVVNDAHTAAEQQDDWAISPELCGREQLVTLWARSYSYSTPETVEFLYSMGSTEPTEFKLIQRVEQLSGEWTQYALVVPEGGRRFAIRGCSYQPLGTAQTFIDNVTFYPATGASQRLDLVGYNVYCDNVLMNSTPVVALEYPIQGGSHSYAVSAVYSTGESRGVSARTAGMELTGNDLRIDTSNGRIILSGLNEVPYTVTSTSGIVYGNGAGVDKVEIPVEAGVYIVRAASRTYKVVVR